MNHNSAKLSGGIGSPNLVTYTLLVEIGRLSNWLVEIEKCDLSHPWKSEFFCYVL
jgi:hypothetical protein